MKHFALLLALSACSRTPAQTQEPVVSDATPAQAAEAEKTSSQVVEKTEKSERPVPAAGNTAEQFNLPPPQMSAVHPEGPSVRIEGCALDGKGATRGGPASKHQDDALSVKAEGKTIVVTHFVNHACCQKGVVKTAQSSETIDITESLDGKACRCMCSSTFTTTVPVSAGRYNVHVTLAAGTNAKDVGTQSVTVE